MADNTGAVALGALFTRAAVGADAATAARVLREGRGHEVLDNVRVLTEEATAAVSAAVPGAQALVAEMVPCPRANAVR